MLCVSALWSQEVTFTVKQPVLENVLKSVTIITTRAAGGTSALKITGDSVEIDQVYDTTTHVFDTDFKVAAKSDAVLSFFAGIDKAGWDSISSSSRKTDWAPFKANTSRHVFVVKTSVDETVIVIAGYGYCEAYLGAGQDVSYQFIGKFCGYLRRL